jgi:ribosomal protein S18 acetylase RimI-like enzyme
LRESARGDPPGELGRPQALVELIGAQNRAVSGTPAIRIEFLRHEWQLPGFSLGLDNVVAENGGQLVGYGAVTPGRELVLAAGDEEVADELLARVLARARERGDEAISLTVASPESPLEPLVKRHDFSLETETLTMYRQLTEPVDEPIAPEGTSFRTFVPSDAPAVHQLLDDAYGEWDPRYVPIAHDDWVTSMTGDPEFDAGVWWLAERDGALAGCVLHWDSGWLKDLAVREPERGRGLGAALVRLGLAEFRRRGLARVGLKVDAANPTGAVRLYQRLGFVTSRREAVWVSTL